MTASTIGTSSIFPADFEKELTVHVFPVLSKIVQCLPTTAMLACESNSVRNEVGNSSPGSVSAWAIKYDSLATTGENLPSGTEAVLHSFFESVGSRATIFMMVRTADKWLSSLLFHCFHSRSHPFVMVCFCMRKVASGHFEQQP